jgi:RNA polymerase sigma-70 factor (ECF subfamily)
LNQPEGWERTVAQAIAGDPRAFADVFRLLGAPVAGYLRGRGVDDADGLTNEVFLRVHRTLPRFDGTADEFRSWVFTIAHNAAVDDGRRRRRRVHETSRASLPDSADVDVETTVLARLADERVRELLEVLTDDQQAVLILRVVSGLSVRETASVLGKGEEAVKALQRRGLATLRRRLTGKEGVPK